MDAPSSSPSSSGPELVEVLERSRGIWRCTPGWEKRIAACIANGVAEELHIYLPLLDRLPAVPVAAPHASRLVEDAVSLWMRPGFETFVSLSRLRFEPFGYQLGAAQAALLRMRGRAILADEVGLGKTIEAGMVLSELYLRQLAQRVLILAPAGLVGQWAEELDRKFALPVKVAAGRRDIASATGASVILLSVAVARRKAIAELLSAQPWDLIIVDEAHRLRNPGSASAQLVKSLKTQYLLLLTATPVVNQLEDLFQLVNLVRPGHLGTPSQFRGRHGTGRPGNEVTGIRGLRTGLRQVMVRHRRSEVAVMLPPRVAETFVVAPSAEEASFYGQVAERVRETAKSGGAREAMGLASLLRLAGSNLNAMGPRLVRAGWDDLAAQVAALPPSRKSEALMRLLAQQVAAGEKVVVFTAFHETQDLLRELASAEGLDVAVYHGRLSRREKDEAIAASRGECQILLTTEAAGEGRNLQFCRALVNYDLPWNPMQIEQRLGRIHRIGQESEVMLWNLVSGGSLEEVVLRVLESKLNLFELVVGELDMVLGRIEDEFDFESFVFRAHVESRDDHEFAATLDKLGTQLSEARQGYLTTRQRADSLVEAME